jgi:hypothetical protein
MQLRPGMTVLGRKARRNPHTVSGFPLHNTYAPLGVRSTAKESLFACRVGLHLAHGPWGRGGGSKKLTKQNLCHRTPKFLSKELDQRAAARAHETARCTSLRMDREGNALTGDPRKYAKSIDTIDQALTTLIHLGRRDLVVDLMRRENARGANHVIRRFRDMVQNCT